MLRISTQRVTELAPGIWFYYAGPRGWRVGYEVALFNESEDLAGLAEVVGLMLPGNGPCPDDAGRLELVDLRVTHGGRRMRARLAGFQVTK